MKKNTIYIIFNKNTRMPVCITDFIRGLVTDDSLYKEIEIEGEDVNLARYRWEGDFDTGKLLDLFVEKKAVVTEELIDKKYYEMFFRKYPLEKVIFKLIHSIDFKMYAMGEDGSMHHNEGYKMQVFLDKLLKKKAEEIESYKKSTDHIFETTEMQNQRIEEAFKTEG